jgi:hypothetical protein
MAESKRFFAGMSALHDTLNELTKKFDELGVRYVVIGGMALTVHGYARMTEDIDVLVTREDLKTIHAELVGKGYRREFAGGKHIRDTETGVKIEFVLTGDFPGSGKPQPVSFPQPSETEPVEHEGVRFIGLSRLVELKLASGMTGGTDRAKDLVDVQELIKVLSLPRDLVAGLNEYVRPKYEELWDGIHAVKRKYLRLWRNKFLTVDAKSLDEMIAGLSSAAEELRQMRADGVVLDPDGGTGDDYAHLVTTDPDIAKKYDMHDESEFFGEDEEDK